MQVITLIGSCVVMGMQEGENTKDDSSEEEREVECLAAFCQIGKDW
jgi:hypothetical protein